jgi:hypothetical protein
LPESYGSGKIKEEVQDGREEKRIFGKRKETG